MVPCRIRVIYGDTDQMGVVYYANYLRWFEAGRAEFVRVLDVPYRDLEAEGLFLPVVEATARYHRSARYDDLLVVETRLTELRRAQMRFEYVIVRDGTRARLCTGHTIHACLRAADGRPTRLPAALVARLSQKVEAGAGPGTG